MRYTFVLTAVMAVLAVAAPQRAEAIGCFSGGALGAIAGHQVHHGVVGAMGGCVAGHYAHKHAKEAAAAQRAQQEKNAAPNGAVTPASTTGAPAPDGARPATQP